LILFFDNGFTNQYNQEYIMTTKFKSDFLNILQDRGFIHQGSDLDGLDQKLISGTQSAYIGFDATAKSLHVGNLLGIMMLYWFQHTGHKPYTLVGGGTTKIGDPSGKDAGRQLLDDRAINENIESLKQAFSKYLKYGSGPQDAVMLNNNDWLNDLNYIDFLRDYGRHFSVNRMLSFDSVKLRLEREQNLSFLEFNYMIFQAYDFVELNRRYGIILQMGGSDQWGNIVNGVELGRRAANLDLFALTCPLLTTSSGAKMGKSAQGAVWLNADMLSPYDYWQYWRNVEDADVGRFLKLYSVLPIDEIARLEKLGGAEINEAKKILAFEVTKLCHGQQAALEASETARKTFEEGEAGSNLPSILIPHNELNAGILFQDLLRRAGLVESNGEAKRLVQGGGARLNDAVVDAPTFVVTQKDLTKDGFIKLSAGKKKHALVKLAS
jgi:tyrosyl-tRNA synthetase